MKNLDKRIISAVTAFGLAVCSMNAGVFNFSEDKVQAETEAVISEVITSVNDNVSLPKTRKGTYSIYAHEEFTATNGILKVLYNEEKLSFRDIRLCESLKNAVNYTRVDASGMIVIGFASDKPITFKDNMISIEFDFAPGQMTGILGACCRLRVDELETEDADGVIQDISNNSLIGSSELWPSIGISYSSNNYAFANIGLFTRDNCGFTNGVFSFEYDPESLEFTEANGGLTFAESMTDSYVVKPGLVKCIVVSDKTISEDGNFLNLKFKVLKDGTADIKGTVIEFNNVVSENDIAEYTPSIPPITINVNTTAIAPPPEVSKIPSVPYTQPYATPKPPSPPYTEPAVTSVSVNETVTTAKINPVTSAAAITTVNPAITTAAAPVTSEAPATSAEPVNTTVKPAETTVKPASTTVVNPVTSEAPVTSAGPVNTTVNPVITTAAPVTTVTDQVVPPVTTSVTTPAPVQNNKTGSVRIGADDDISATNGKIVLTYDPDKMTYEGIELADQVGRKINEISTSEPGKIVIGFSSNEPVEISHIADVQFRYADSITDPSSVCTVEAQKLETVDGTGKVVSVDPASVHVSTVSEAENVKGDVNGDGAITTGDIVELIKTILGELAPTVNSDVDGDGKTDAADLLALRNIFLS